TGEDDISCVTDGKSVWAREPSFPWPWGSSPLTVGPSTASDQPPAEPTTGCLRWVRVGVRDCLGAVPNNGIFMCADTADAYTIVPGGRNMYSAIGYILQQYGCPGIQPNLRSDFF